MTTHHGAPLRHNPTARLHLGGIWINSLGGGVFDVALPLIVLLSTGSLSQMAMIAVAGQLPKAVPGFLIGGIVDRQPPRRMMLLGYTGQAVVVATIPVAMLMGSSSFALLIVVAYLRGSFDMFARTATFVAIPVMYGDDTPSFNAAFSTAWTSSAIIGPAVGGALATVVAPELLLGIDALSFAVMIVVVRRLPVPTTPSSGDDEPSLAAALRDGYRYLGGMTGWWPFVATVVCVGALYAPLLTLALYTVSEIRDEGPRIVGFVSSAAAAGLFVGSLAAQRWSAREPRSMMLRASTVMTAGTALFFVEHWAATAAAVAVVCAGGIYWTIARTTILHQRVAAKHMGKAMTAIQFLETFIGPLSLVVATILVERVSPGTAYAYLLVAAALSGAIVSLTPRLLDPSTTTEETKRDDTPSRDAHR